MEKRILSREVRASDEGVLLGTAVVYNSWSDPICGYFVEQMIPGCFDDCLAGSPDVICTVDHNTSLLLGRTASSTLKLVNSDTGLTVEVVPPDTTTGRDIRELIKRGDIKGMSFTFECLTDDWNYNDGKPARSVLKANLFEVAFVATPAYPSTSVDMRSVRGNVPPDVLRRKINLKFTS